MNDCSLCLAVGLGHSQSLPSHMVLGGQCQSLSNSQTFVIIAQREAFLSTLSSIANIRHNSLAQHFFSHQSIHPHVVHALGHCFRQYSFRPSWTKKKENMASGIEHCDVIHRAVSAHLGTIQILYLFAPLFQIH